MIHKEKQFGILNPGFFISELLGSLSQDGLETIVRAYIAMKNKLIKNQKISKYDGDKVEEMIKAGLLANEEMHKLYPHRS